MYKTGRIKDTLAVWSSLAKTEGFYIEENIESLQIQCQSLETRPRWYVRQSILKWLDPTALVHNGQNGPMLLVYMGKVFQYPLWNF